MTINPAMLAYDFAAKKHAGQVRKYTGEPYIEHCRAVGNMVAERTNDLDVVAAAYLHDVIEDTDVQFGELVSKFGERIAKLVAEVTDIFTSKTYPTMNRKMRKRCEAERLGQISDEAKLIKLCDLIDNTVSIVRYDPDFAVVYLREKADILEAMGYGKARSPKPSTCR